MFGRKLDVSQTSTLGGWKVDLPQSGMEYGPALTNEPFTRGGREQHVLTLGVMRSVKLTGDEGIGAFQQARAETRQIREPSERTRQESTLDERLRRLGIRPRGAR